MLVYRIETTGGSGPYAFYTPLGLRSRASTHCNRHLARHPSPEADLYTGWRNIPDYTSYIFGFDSIKQLKRWFWKRDREALHNQGYVLAVYEVSNDRVLKGRKQVAFKRYRTKNKPILYDLSVIDCLSESRSKRTIPIETIALKAA